MGPGKFMGVLLLFCHVGQLVAGEWIRPYFASRNFKNVLHWDNVDNPGGGEVLYSVLYRSDEMPAFRPKAACQNLTALSCDLTAETPYIYDVYYYARVEAHTGPIGKTRRFSPMRDTVLGPPILSVIPTPSSLRVTVTLPLAPDNKTSIEDIFNNSIFASQKPPTFYTLNITHPKWAAQVKRSHSGQFDVPLKNNNTEYCGYVVYCPHLVQHRTPSERKPFCVTLPADPWMLFPWILLAAGLVLLSLLTLTLCLCRYVKKPRGLPDSLTKTLKIPLEVPKPPTEVISIATPAVGFVFLNVAPHTHGVTLARPKATSGYSAQDTVAQPWQPYRGQKSPDLPPYDTSTASSTTYGTVMVRSASEDTEDSHLSAEEDSAASACPDRQRDSRSSVDKGPVWPVLVPQGAPPMMDSQVQEQAPIGHTPVSTWQEDVGQLPNFLIQPEVKGFTGSLTLPAAFEGRPLSLGLLTMGEWDDSSCADRNTYSNHHSSYKSQNSLSQPLLPTPLSDCETSDEVVVQSGYKQNWLPVSPVALTTQGSRYRPLHRTSCDQHWTDPEGGDEEEEDEPEDTRNEIHLGKWVVQIHG